MGRTEMIDMTPSWRQVFGEYITAIGNYGTDSKGPGVDAICALNRIADAIEAGKVPKKPSPREFFSIVSANIDVKFGATV